MGPKRRVPVWRVAGTVWHARGPVTGVLSIWRLWRSEWLPKGGVPSYHDKLFGAR